MIWSDVTCRQWKMNYSTSKSKSSTLWYILVINIFSSIVIKWYNFYYYYYYYYHHHHYVFCNTTSNWCNSRVAAVQIFFGHCCMKASIGFNNIWSVALLNHIVNPWSPGVERNIGFFMYYIYATQTQRVKSPRMKKALTLARLVVSYNTTAILPNSRVVS